MHTAPVKLLPVDPAAPNTRRDTVDRGFAEFLRRDEASARADTRPDPAQPSGRDAAPAKRAARPDEDGGERTARTEAPGAQPTDRDTTQTDPDNAPADSTPEAGEPEATAPASEATQVAVIPVETPAAPAPGVPQLADGAEAVTGSMAPEEGPAGGTRSLPAASPAGTVAPEARPDAMAPGTLDEAAASGARNMADLPAPGSSPNIAGQPPDAAAEPKPETFPAPVGPAALAAVPGAPEAAEAASTVAGTLAATQAGGPRSVTGTSGPATPAPPGAAANAATDAGNAEAHPAPSGAAGAAPPQNKGADAGGQTGIAAQALPSAQPGDQAAGGSGAAPLETLKAGGEPSQRVADAPPPGHSQNTTASTAFANELRLSSTASPLTETAAGRTAAGPVVEQVAVQISRAASGGQDKLTIDLRPAVLGRVSVSLELGHDHRVIAVISADRPDTLDLLQRDARLLERALQDAGLKTDSGSLSFSLNGDGTKEPPYGDAATADQFVAGHPAEDDGDTPSAAYDPYARAVNATGIDIHV